MLFILYAAGPGEQISFLYVFNINLNWTELKHADRELYHMIQ